MEEHLAAAGVRPLIESDRGIGAERNCAGRLFDAQAEQARTRRRGGDRAGDAGGTVDPRHFGIHHGASDLPTDFIANHCSSGEIAPADTAILRQRQQGRQHNYAQMADAAGVHVFAYQAMPHHGVRERRITAGEKSRRSDDGRTAGFAIDVLRELHRLSAPRQVARLESAAYEIDQAQLHFVRDFCRQIFHRHGRNGSRHTRR